MSYTRNIHPLARLGGSRALFCGTLLLGALLSGPEAIGQQTPLKLVRHVVSAAAISGGSLRATAGQSAVGSTTALPRVGLLGFWFDGAAMATPVERVPLRPTAITVSAYPNPFRDHAMLTIELPEERIVTVDIFDAAGRSVARIHDGAANGGAFSLRWDGRDASGRMLPSGTYLALVRGSARRGGDAAAASVVLLHTR
jgi:hypothetical protein